MKSTLAILALLILAAPGLVSCVTIPSPTPDELLAADYGEKPALEPAKEHLQVLIFAQLKDPDSAKVAWGDLEQAWCQPWQAKENLFCWSLPVSVNAKNSYGGYVGARLWTGYFRGEDLVAMGVPRENRTVIVSMD